MKINNLDSILPGQVQSVPPGAHGFDTDTPLLSYEIAKKFYNDGYRFCIRYLSLFSPSHQKSKDLSREEALLILESGLALMAVQHVRELGWNPASVSGTTDGKNAAKNAKNVGLPPGVNIWCDLEGVKDGTKASAVTGYCNNWMNNATPRLTPEY